MPQAQQDNEVLLVSREQQDTPDAQGHMVTLERREILEKLQIREQLVALDRLDLLVFKEFQVQLHGLVQREIQDLRGIATLVILVRPDRLVTQDLLVLLARQVLRE